MIFIPASQYKKRGGVIRYRTIKLSDDTYAHVAIVRKSGRRGGRTILGRIRKVKGR